MKALTIGCQPVLSLFSTGRTRGCVVEVGEGASFTVPVFEGLALQHAILRQEVAGQDITRCLLRTLMDRKLPFQKNNMPEVRTIKEKVPSSALPTTGVLCDSITTLQTHSRTAGQGD